MLLLNRWLNKPRHLRLKSEIEILSIEVEHRAARQNVNDSTWHIHTQTLLQKAILAHQNSNYDECSRYLHAARRMSVYGLDGMTLEAQSYALREESRERMNTDWRGRAITHLLDQPNVQADQLDAAMLIRDINTHNTAFRLLVRRRSLEFILFCLLALLIAIPLMVYYAFLPVKLLGNYEKIIAIEVFGVLGAVFSIATNLTQNNVSSRLQIEIMGSFITWMRPIIGAGAALATHILLESGFLDTILQADKENVVMALAFISGFSERFVIDSLQRVAPNNDVNNTPILPKNTSVIPPHVPSHLPEDSPNAARQEKAIVKTEVPSIPIIPTVSNIPAYPSENAPNEAITEMPNVPTVKMDIMKIIPSVRLKTVKPEDHQDAVG